MPLLTRQLAFVALLLGASHSAWAEFILFPELNGILRRDIESHKIAIPHGGYPLRENQPDAALAVFYSADYGRLRVLAELDISREVDADLERLQAGWLLGSETTAWIGRFHTPLGYWNTQYHHGSYLQTSATRPGIMEFHGLKAPLPLHIAGLLIEGAHPLENQEIHYQFSLGAGPNLQHHGLEPVDFRNLDNAGSHKLNAAVRLSYLPDPVIPDEIGGFAAYTVIPSIHKTIREIRQTIAGVFGNWEYERLRLIGELYFVSNDLVADSGTARASFFNYNLQAEYTLHPDWTLYARAEDTLNAENDPYLDIFPEFIRRRALAGLRFDLTHNQALKLEWAGVTRQHDRFNEIILQWSAAFP